MNDTILSDKPPDRQQRDRIYRWAYAEYNGRSPAELAGIITELRHDLASADELDPASAEVHRNLIEPYLTAATDVERRRAARFQVGAGPDPNEPRQVAWCDLADRVRRDADIIAIFDRFGHALHRQGAEYGAACPACGGDDRLRIFPTPDRRAPVPRAWCRRCGWGADVISLLRSFSGMRFYDAVTDLAGELGLPVPSSGGRRQAARVVTL